MDFLLNIFKYHYFLEFERLIRTYLGFIWIPFILLKIKN